jgi:hypothetical protein
MFRGSVRFLLNSQISWMIQRMILPWVFPRYHYGNWSFLGIIGIFSNLALNQTVCTSVFRKSNAHDFATPHAGG